MRVEYSFDALTFAPFPGVGIRTYHLTKYVKTFGDTEVIGALLRIFPQDTFLLLKAYYESICLNGFVLRHMFCDAPGATVYASTSRLAALSAGQGQQTMPLVRP